MRRFGLLVLGGAAAAGLALPRTPLRRRRSVRGGADASPAVKPFSAELKPQRASAKDVFATAARHAWPKGDWPQHALVVAAVAFLVGQKLLNVRVPFLLSRVVDALQASEADKASQAAAAYVLGRVLTSACGELRSICFARVSFAGSVATSCGAPPPPRSTRVSERSTRMRLSARIGARPTRSGARYTRRVMVAKASSRIRIAKARSTRALRRTTGTNLL